MITLTEKDLKDLNEFIQELPVKYGMPLINFLNTKAQEQSTPAPASATTDAGISNDIA